MNTSTEASAFATKQDLAQRYGVHPRQIQKLIDDGRIPGYQLGPRIWRFNPDEVDAALRNGGERD